MHRRHCSDGKESREIRVRYTGPDHPTCRCRALDSRRSYPRSASDTFPPWPAPAEACPDVEPALSHQDLRYPTLHCQPPMMISGRELRRSEENRRLDCALSWGCGDAPRPASSSSLPPLSPSVAAPLSVGHSLHRQAQTSQLCLDNFRQTCGGRISYPS
jgi:hypothetical protein